MRKTIQILLLLSLISCNKDVLSGLPSIKKGCFHDKLVNRWWRSTHPNIVDVRFNSDGSYESIGGKGTWVCTQIDNTIKIDQKGYKGTFQVLSIEDGVMYAKLYNMSKAKFIGPKELYIDGVKQ